MKEAVTVVDHWVVDEYTVEFVEHSDGSNAIEVVKGFGGEPVDVTDELLSAAKARTTIGPEDAVQLADL